MSWISRRQASHAVSWRSPVTCILQWRYLACCFRIYCVPEEVFRPVVDAAVSMKLHAAAEAVVAQTVRQVEEGYETVMAESRSRNVQMEENT